MPDPTGSGLFIEGPFSHAFGEVSRDAAAVPSSVPATAIAYARATSPTVSGGVASSTPSVAIAYARATSPEVSGGVVSSVPAVAIADCICISPAYIATGRAVLAIFGAEPKVKADEWNTEPRITADQWAGGVV